MNQLEGHSFMTHRPNATCRVLWRVAGESGVKYRWNGEVRLHDTQADAYDAVGLDPAQAPKEP